MIFGIDYDETYTADPVLFNSIIALMNRRNHQVLIVTMRYDHEPIEQDVKTRVSGVFYTGRKAKKPFMEKLGINIDIWIDDTPAWIIDDSADVTWRAPTMEAFVEVYHEQAKESYVLWQSIITGEIVASSSAWPDRDDEFERIGLYGALVHESGVVYDSKSS